MVYPPFSSVPVRRHYGVFLDHPRQFIGTGFDLHLQFSEKINPSERKKVSNLLKIIPIFVNFS
jgi:hypothetical protein